MRIEIQVLAIGITVGVMVGWTGRAMIGVVVGFDVLGRLV